MLELVKVSERNILGVSNGFNNVGNLKVIILGKKCVVRKEFSSPLESPKTLKLSDFSGISINYENFSKGRYSLKFNDNEKLKRVNVTLPIVKDSLAETVLEYWAAGWFVQIDDTIKLQDFIEPQTPPKRDTLLETIAAPIRYNDDDDDDEAQVVDDAPAANVPPPPGNNIRNTFSFSYNYFRTARTAIDCEEVLPVIPRDLTW